MTATVVQTVRNLIAFAAMVTIKSVPDVHIVFAKTSFIVVAKIRNAMVWLILKIKIKMND